MSTHATKGPWTPVQAPDVPYWGIRTSDLATTVATRLSGISEANARLAAAAPELLEALKALLFHPHVNLGDLVYAVRDREGLGWTGRSVTAWNQAVLQAKAAIAKAEGS